MHRRVLDPPLREPCHPLRELVDSHGDLIALGRHCQQGTIRGVGPEVKGITARPGIGGGFFKP
eukprot:7655025-Lingulodinium_polyedra.AAC.1